MTATTAIPPARVHGWDRAAIGLLGAAGCALSYDALQQMATAIHVRGPLTYLFPFVIDGFIAYGVRALLVLRTALFPARLYVWTLFGTATAASIWANALHAVRLNQQLTASDGLRLGDTTVGILSTLAPLALAGAVHLYILIARHPTAGTRTADHRTSDETTISGPQPSRTTDIADQLEAADPQPGVAQEQLSLPVDGTPSPAPDAGQTDTDADADRATVLPLPIEEERPRPKRTGRPPGAEKEKLLAIGRQAIVEKGKATRWVVEQAVRAQGITLGGERLTEIMNILRAEFPDDAHDSGKTS